MASLQLPDNSLGRAVQLVIKHCGFEAAIQSSSSDSLKLSTPAGDCIGLLAVCRYVAEQSGKTSALGSNEIEQAQVVQFEPQTLPMCLPRPFSRANHTQVLQWLTWATSELKQLTDDKLEKVCHNGSTRHFIIMHHYDLQPSSKGRHSLAMELSG
jgi:hypothetical protein